MLPVDLFRLPIFALSAATAVCSFVVQGMAFVALPFYFQETLHRTAVETGLFMTPWPLVVAIMAPIAGRLSDRYPAGILGGIGLALLCLGMGLLATLPAAPTDRRYRLAHGAVRMGIWFLPGSQPEGADVERATGPQRQRQQYRGDGPSHRANHWRGAGRILFQLRRPRRRRGGPGAGRGSSRGRQPDELPAPDRDPATRVDRSPPTHDQFRTSPHARRASSFSSVARPRRENPSAAPAARRCRSTPAIVRSRYGRAAAGRCGQRTARAGC